jgi:Xaa-Pro aminopeptidase
MARLFTDPKTVEKMSGLSLKGSMTMPTQAHDRRYLLPAILSTTSQDYFLVRQIDCGNLTACGFTRMPVVPFSPYWVPRSTEKIPRTVAEAVLSRLGGEPLTMDAATPAVVYEQLRASIGVEVEPEVAHPVDAFRLRRSEVLQRFNHHRREVADVARRLTRSHPQAQHLDRWLADAPNPSFQLLEQMAADQGVSALLGSWGTDFQELSGLRGLLAEEEGCAALFLLGTDEIWILAPAGLNLGLPGNAKSYPSVAKAVRDIAGQGQVGFELDTLGAARLLDLRERGVPLADAGMLLRDWREEKAWYDVPYFVVGALASRQAIEGAASFAGQAIRAGVEIRERDVDRVYRNLLHEFEVESRLPVRLEFYFVNNHAGSRTILPSRPTDYPLSAGSTTLKIDAGIFVVDDGLFHACTDLARTVTTTPAAAEVFEAMEQAVVAEIIPGIRTEMTGEQIHSLGVGKMAEHESVFRTHGYMPDDFSWRTGYVRDVGHVIERQESYTFYFRPGAKRPLHPGMIACVEIHCVHDGHNLTIEDTFVADEAGPIIISRIPEEFGPDGKVVHYPRR